MRQVILDKLGTEDLNLIKIIPIPKYCNCLRCKQMEWSNIEAEIKERGSLVYICESEGYFELDYESGKIYLETHESGPEIIVLISNSLALITAIISLILTITKGFKIRNGESHYNIIIRKYRKSEEEEEIQVEFDSSAPDARKIISEFLDKNLAE